MTSQHWNEGDRLTVDSGIEALHDGPEFRGPVEILEGDPCADHLALLYETTAEQLAVIVPFVRQGLERGDRCLVVRDALSTAALLEALREGGVDVDAARSSGALSITTVDETYLRHGSFDPDGMVDFYADAIAEATTASDGFRITADVTWLADDPAAIPDFMAYESQVNDLLASENCIVLCQYDRTAFDPAVIHDVIKTHPHLIVDGTVCHNEIIACRERSLEAKIRSTLALGCEWLGLDLGGVARVDADCDWFEIEHWFGDHEHLETGLEIPLSETFCGALDLESRSIGVFAPQMQGFSDVAVFAELGLQTYLGTYVPVQGGHDRTFFFCSAEAREEPFEPAVIALVELLGQWVKYELERERQSDQLAAVNQMARDLMDAETTSAIVERTVEHADSTLRLPMTSVLTYDTRTGSLVPEAQTPGMDDVVPIEALCERGSGPLWEAFVANEVCELDATDDAPETPAHEWTLVAVPLGQQGVFVTATRDPDGFDPAAREIIEMTAATVEAACTRAVREQMLHHREDTLEAQNEALERLNHVNTIIRSIDRALVQASSRSEIEAVVCDALADAGPYELAWIGDTDSPSAGVRTRESAGREKRHFEQLHSGIDLSGAGQGPIETAFRTWEPAVVNHVLRDDSPGAWRQAVLSRGYHACIGLPLVYGESLYGVLAIYATDPGAFDQFEVSVLSEMVDTIAYAINAVESKKAIVSSSVTTLTFDMMETDLAFGDMARELDCAFTLESIAPDANGLIRCFFAARGVPAATLMAYEEQLSLSDLTLITEHEADDEPVQRFEATIDDECICTTALEHGGRPVGFETTPDTALFSVEIAADAAVRQFVEVIHRAYPGAELVAQRSEERQQQTETEFLAHLTTALTDRQLEALQVAYFSGYFDEPRLCSAADVASRMDIAQPTFSSHLRSAHRKLCRQLFEPNDTAGRPASNGTDPRTRARTLLR